MRLAGGIGWCAGLVRVPMGLCLLLAVFVGACSGVRTDARGPLMAEAVTSSRPLVVRDSVGGQVYETAALVRALERSGREVRIERDCLSACGMLLALSRVCYQPDARFGFHAATVRGEIDPPSQALLTQHFPPGLRDWFRQSGADATVEGFRYLSGRELAGLDSRARLCPPG